MKRYLIQASSARLPLADESVQCVVTSPPYWGLRQYAGEQREVWGGDAGCAHEWATTTTTTTTTNGTGGSTLSGGRDSWGDRGGDTVTGYCACGAWYGALGLEPTPELYVEHMVAVFREVRRVLRKDGTLWLNLGDSYASTTSGTGARGGSFASERSQWQGAATRVEIPTGLKPKDLVGIPWMVAFALRADGWYLRSDIIWHKPNPMPESVTDRPTKSHEYLFLLTKSERYYYDADAIREAMSEANAEHLRRYGDRYKTPHLPSEAASGNNNRSYAGGDPERGRNKRTVWTIATRPYPGAHFATFPEQLVEPCILAGSARQACGVCGAPWERVTERENMTPRDTPYDAGRPDGMTLRGTQFVGGSTTTGWQPTCAHQDGTCASVVIDPFNGSGTTGRVAIKHGRDYIGVDISAEYLTEQATKRVDNIQQTMGL